MKKQLVDKNEMLLVDDISARSMQQLARDLMNDNSLRRQEDGKLIKWILEKLDLWEEENADATGDRTKSFPGCGDLQKPHEGEGISGSENLL